MLWMRNLLQGLKKDNSISYLDKMEVVLLVACAQVCTVLKKAEDAKNLSSVTTLAILR